MILQKISFLEPVTESQVNYRVKGNSVMFRNKGATTAILDYACEIAPGEAVSFNTDNPNVIIVQNLTITFSGIGSNRLEVTVMNTSGGKAEDYIERPKISQQ